MWLHLDTFLSRSESRHVRAQVVKDHPGAVKNILRRPYWLLKQNLSINCDLELRLSTFRARRYWIHYKNKGGTAPRAPRWSRGGLKPWFSTSRNVLTYRSATRLAHGLLVSFDLRRAKTMWLLFGERETITSVVSDTKKVCAARCFF